jgi:hypothetical protein
MKDNIIASPGIDGGIRVSVCWSSAISTGRSAAWIWATHSWNVSRSSPTAASFGRTNDRIEFAFPLVSEECGRCGTCKRSLLDRFRPDYDRIIYVGDGDSDVCAARTADQIFAKEILYEKCVSNGTPCLLYDDFGDIRRSLEKNLSGGI